MPESKMIFGLDSQVEKALGHVTQIKWKTDVAKKERQVKTASSISAAAAWEKARAVGGNLKSDSDVDDDEDAQNKRFLICESAATSMFQLLGHFVLRFISI